MDLAKLQEAKSRQVVAWTRLVSAAQSWPNDVLWVCEGKDDLQFYPARIERFFGKYPRAIVIADGKGNAVALREQAMQSVALKRRLIAFLLDRDFDDPATLKAGHPLTYVTPTYAIENIIVTGETIERLAIERFHLVAAEDEQELKDVVALYKSWLTVYCNAVSPYSVWLMMQKRCVGQIRIGDTLNSHIEISFSGASLNVSLALPAHQLHTVVPGSAAIGEAEIDAEVAQVRADPISCLGFVRGKFLIPFVKAVLHRLVDDSNARTSNTIFLKRRRCDLKVSAESVVSLLSQYAPTPECLVRFLGFVQQTFRETANDQGDFFFLAESKPAG